jgi:hypothetical protein
MVPVQVIWELVRPEPAEGLKVIFPGSAVLQFRGSVPKFSTTAVIGNEKVDDPANTPYTLLPVGNASRNAGLVADAMLGARHTTSSEQIVDLSQSVERARIFYDLNEGFEMVLITAHSE